MSDLLRITERYRLDKLIHASDTASVFRSTDVRSGHTVALKLFREDAGEAREEVRARFAAAAEALRACRHPSLPRLLDHGFTATGSPFLATEYLQGAGFELLTGSSVGRVLPLLLPVLDGLEEMDRHQLAHRNLRPDNLLLVTLGDEERLVILGWGPAAATGPDNAEAGRRADLRGFAEITCAAIGAEILHPVLAVSLPPAAATEPIADAAELTMLLSLLLQPGVAAPASLYGELRRAFRQALTGDPGPGAAVAAVPAAGPASAGGADLDQTLAVAADVTIAIPRDRLLGAPDAAAEPDNPAAPRGERVGAIRGDTLPVFRPHDLGDAPGPASPAVPRPDSLGSEAAPLIAAGSRADGLAGAVEPVEPDFGTLAAAATGELDESVGTRAQVAPLAGSWPAASWPAAPPDPPRAEPPATAATASPRLAPAAGPLPVPPPPRPRRQRPVLLGAAALLALTFLVVVPLSWMGFRSRVRPHDPRRAAAAAPTALPAVSARAAASPAAVSTPAAAAALPAAATSPPAAPAPGAAPAGSPAAPGAHLKAAAALLADGDAAGARRELAQVPAEQQAAFGPAERADYDQLVAALADHRRKIAAELATALSGGDMRHIRAKAAAAGREPDLPPAARHDLDHARQAIDLDKRLAGADLGQGAAEALRNATALAALLPRYTHAAEVRERAAKAIEDQSDGALAAGDTERATALLAGLRQAWPDRPELAARTERIEARRRADGQLDAALAAAAKAEAAGQPLQGLQALAAVNPGPPGSRDYDRFRGQHERLDALLAKLDAAPPAIALAPGFKLEYDTDARVAVPLRITDDLAVKSAECWVRPEGATAYQQVPVRHLADAEYVVDIGPELHKNGTVELYVVATDHSGHRSLLGGRERPLKLKHRPWWKHFGGKGGGQDAGGQGGTVQ